MYIETMPIGTFIHTHMQIWRKTLPSCYHFLISSIKGIHLQSLMGLAQMLCVFFIMWLSRGPWNWQSGLPYAFVLKRSFAIRRAHSEVFHCFMDLNGVLEPFSLYRLKYTQESVHNFLSILWHTAIIWHNWRTKNVIRGKIRPAQSAFQNKAFLLLDTALSSLLSRYETS